MVEKCPIRTFPGKNSVRPAAGGRHKRRHMSHVQTNETGGGRHLREGAPRREAEPSGPKAPDEPKERRGRRFFRVFWSTVYTLIVIAAVVVLISNLFTPVLHIYGHSMNETLDEGDIVVALRGGDFKTGDIIGFYYNNQILIKRVIGSSGDWIDIDEEGTVYVNNKKLEEPYLDEKAFGECNITLPYQVPESRLFVMGDNRAVSIDSRNTAVGCVAEEQIVGKILGRIWPYDRIGLVE